MVFLTLKQAFVFKLYCSNTCEMEIFVVRWFCWGGQPAADEIIVFEADFASKIIPAPLICTDYSVSLQIYSIAGFIRLVFF